jgi:hypothetical protein
MSCQHKQLKNGQWFKLSLAEQLANVGSEVIRALNWKQKGNTEYTLLAFERALELLDFTISDPRHNRRLREICRLREVLCDYFVGENIYNSTVSSWENYFYAFNWSARINH